MGILSIVSTIGEILSLIWEYYLLLKRYCRYVSYLADTVSTIMRDTSMKIPPTVVVLL